MANRKRNQFTISAILILMLVAALGVVGWQKFIYVHPAHENPMYEKARYTNRGTITLNGNTLKIKSVSRSERNGQLLVENGFGNPLKTQVANSGVLKASGSWLDAAQVELHCSPTSQSATQPIEVVEVRIFDHATRQLVWKTDPQSGYRLCDPMTLQIYRLGGKLPNLVDVWFRVRSYPDPKREIVKLAPKLGGTARGFGGEFQVADLVRGFKSYASGVLTGSESNAMSETAAIVSYKGDWPKEKRVQVVSVMSSGERHHLGRFYRFDQAASHVFHLTGAADAIDHIEIQPFVDRDVFFFQGVKLPLSSMAAFSAAPRATVEFGETELEMQSPLVIDAFLPLKVELEYIPGRISGTSAGPRGANIAEVVPDEKIGSFVARMRGMSRPAIRTTIPGAPRVVSSGTASSSAESLKFESFEIRSKEIRCAELSMPSPDPTRLVFPN